ncbi:DUF559 domain-containing protein [Planomonospora sp. ID91781]|uniref:DUF559 domain-containing protein n=1 Tax=Planomonospora sp. ID91781 TaxID=2738135 RepID=UPI0018C39556|nr:DUF559 domain-containing protein [Planomonospora sp. ID91781]MBG0820176.1 DUF559 domain-containing protein [Planomonospora sp. ID91781]
MAQRRPGHAHLAARRPQAHPRRPVLLRRPPRRPRHDLTSPPGRVPWSCGSRSRAGLPRPVSQFEICEEAGLRLARVDLAYPDAKLAIEYDGDNHNGRWMKDVLRQNQIFSEGWRLRRYTKQAMYGAPELIVQEVARLLADPRSP